ncbi:MAG: hypothetical protein DCC65_00180 [Planctomycetota bacterium]|nr:MAG: hypothetical protein DCC65_00180 [Planctomycetota bacterium]
MNITEIRVKLVGNEEERLKAFCSVTLDGAFVIRDLKVIEGANGPFVAMPSRKLSDRCPKCGSKNHLRARFCNECGAKLDPNRAPRDAEGRVKLHADVAHPINASGREYIQREVLKAFERELDAARLPGYEPLGVDYDEELGESEYDDFISEIRDSVSQRNARRAAAPSQPPAPPRAPAPERRDARGSADNRRANTPAGRTTREAASPPPAIPRPAPTQPDDPFSAGIV